MGGRGATSVTELTTRSFTNLSTTGGGAEERGVDFMQTKIAGASGSNEGGVYRGSDGVERYIKLYKDPTQAYSETLANDIYRDLGIAAPKSVTFITKDGKTAFASEIVHDTKGIGRPTTQGVAKQIMNGFAADVLLANRDVVGLVNDNIRLTSNGKIVRIDNGASFLHRAMGSRKDAGDLDKISEFNFFLGKSTQYAPIAKLAGIITGASMGKDLNRQINVISSLENKYGSWSKYVSAKLPKWKGSDRDTIVKMLTTRTKLLKSKLNK